VRKSPPRNPSGVQQASPIRLQLARRAPVVRREHRAEGRHDDIEAAVGIGQRLRIRGLEHDVEPFGGGASPAAFEERRHVVGRRDLRETPRRGKRRVAVAGRHVEHALAAAHIDRLAERLADDLQCRADNGEVARGPHRLLPHLHRAEITRALCRIARDDGSGRGRHRRTAFLMPARW
jgi:hypothetical protein